MKSKIARTREPSKRERILYEADMGELYDVISDRLTVRPLPPGLLRSTRIALRAALGIEQASAEDAATATRIAAVGRGVLLQSQHADTAPLVREIAPWVARVMASKLSKPARRARLLAETVEARFKVQIERRLTRRSDSTVTLGG